MKRWRGVSFGAGYFSRFHYDAWRRLDDVEIVAVCDLDGAKAEQVAREFGIATALADPAAALDIPDLDFVDIITPPAAHLPLVQAAAGRARAIICQKPLAPDYATALSLVATAREKNCRLMVHENFRFQPWHREIRRLLDQGTIGDRLHTITCRSRPGDGWGADAYLARQPYFRTMPRLLVHETGVHLIDVFRFLGGELDSAWADLRRLNEAIAGEDAGLLTFRFQSGALAVWDANRCNESTAADPRYTFGEFLIEGSGGSIRLYPDGRLTVQRLGQGEVDHPYEHSQRGFGGDCVFATQRHFIDCLKTGQPFETGGEEYLKNLQAVEAVYEAARTGNRVRLPLPLGEGRGEGESAAQGTLSQRERGPRRRIIDLSLPIDERLPGAKIEVFKRLEIDGWNATNITLYSHCGTHMDAPKHFVPGGDPLEKMDLAACCGPARVLDLTPVQPRELIGVAHLRRWAESIRPGDRLLLRTDWHRRFGTPGYRNELPRIAPELATWLVERRVALLGVEPPSVADVNSLEELTVVHRILLGGNVVIVEGLAYLDQLRSERVNFIALSLRIVGGDGCPVRAIAIESD
jgi:predicted dehydrogenase/kynurenine formamidase